MSIWSQARELISNSLQQKLSVITHRIRNEKSDLEMECPKFLGHLPQPSSPQDTFAFYLLSEALIALIFPKILLKL